MRSFLVAMLLLVAPVAFAATVDLNAATAEELDALPGIGPTTAQAILDYRKEHGKFGTVDELDSVKGIGDATMAKLRPLVSVGGGGTAVSGDSGAEGVPPSRSALDADLRGRGRSLAEPDSASPVGDRSLPTLAAQGPFGANRGGVPSATPPPSHETKRGGAHASQSGAAACDEGDTCNDDAPPAKAPASAAPSAGGASGSGCPVNINTGDATWLQDLPGVGPGKASAILEDRATSGLYGSCSDLDRVKGFGPASLEKLASCCVVK